jgi:hypothetical protein
VGNTHKKVGLVVAIAVLAFLGDSTFAQAANARGSRPDRKPPRISLKAPRNHSTVSGMVAVRARAFDKKGVVGVEFRLDGTDLGTDDSSRSSYSILWNTTTASDGTHTLTATARDAAGNERTASIRVRVANPTSSGGGGTAPDASTPEPAPDVSEPEIVVEDPPTGPEIIPEDPPADPEIVVEDPPTEPEVIPEDPPAEPGAGDRFVTLPPGSPLPSDAECAARVRRSSWEPRPGNVIPNNTNVYVQGVRLSGSDLRWYGYEDRVTGDFTGTTDEILQWVACKWGIDEDIVRAQAVMESYWDQYALGDCRGGTVPDTDGCQSVGILQVKGADVPPTHPGTWPYAYVSTAFNADYTYGIWRACFEGREDWLGDGYAAGDAWGCVGRWFSGDWYRGSREYISRVQQIMDDEVWLDPDF